MWFTKSVFDKFHQVLRIGSLREANQILVSVISGEEKPAGAPSSCPHCHKNLISQALPYLELFVNACPEKHGFWMTPESSVSLKKFISEQILMEMQKKYKLRLLKSFFIGFCAVLALHLAWPVFQNLKTACQNWLDQKESSMANADKRNPENV